MTIQSFMNKWYVLTVVPVVIVAEAVLNLRALPSAWETNSWFAFTLYFFLTLIMGTAIVTTCFFSKVMWKRIVISNEVYDHFCATVPKFCYLMWWRILLRQPVTLMFSCIFLHYVFHFDHFNALVFFAASVVNSWLFDAMEYLYLNTGADIKRQMQMFKEARRGKLKMVCGVPTPCKS